MELIKEQEAANSNSSNANRLLGTAGAVSGKTRIIIAPANHKVNHFAGQFIFAGNLIEYNSADASPDFTIPEGMEIIPWGHPRLSWLTFKGKLMAGPARREVLESFVHDLITKSESQGDLAMIRGGAVGTIEA